ncbi:hypothetical protein [Mycolicibacterium austroafricanum]|uniref:hypothetical protein n=1 Tax=Mycolicibacterium austroafricanum TaxID=39687 RepID=UPI000CF9443B|nr:hypothetical protein [Mycolicibacterium austroafricanum]PQP52657.1 hypothetical protein C6A88_05360 [Mycolicibacterium austroafricanum]
MSDRERKALCCVCGSIRTCKRSRRHREENYWFSGPIDLDWHRETGELKCQECGRVTTHALLHPEGDWAVDHAEMMQRVATGNSHGHFNADQLEEVAAKYRQGLPRNPNLGHYWYKAFAQEDWDAGRRTTKALCGEKVTLHRDPSGPSSGKRWGDDRQIKPRAVRDQEYEDSETGVSWIEADCVDCLRVWHLELLRQRREDLAEKMTEFLKDLLADKAGYPKKIDLRTVESLIGALDAARDAVGTVKTEGIAQ